MSSRPPSSRISAQKPIGTYAKAPPVDSDDDMSDSSDDEADGDSDWLPNVPGRPAPYSWTWSDTYAAIKDQANGTRTIACGEKGDGEIVMDGQSCEIGSKSIQVGKKQRPPVCHITPWVAISNGITHRKPPNRTVTAAFEKFACWGKAGNLRPGHTSCNAGGAKATLANMTGAEINKGIAEVDEAILEWAAGGNGPPYV